MMTKAKPELIGGEIRHHERLDIQSRFFGLAGAQGQPSSDTGANMATWAQMISCPITAMPVIEYVTLTITLPVSDTAIQASFGDVINVLNTQGTPPGVAQVDSSFAINGMLNANMLVCGIGIHAFGEPISFTTIGNGLSTSLTSLPLSPDVFTHNDLTWGALGTTTGIIPADFEWGFADWQAMWHLTQGYQFQWVFCQRYLLINELMADVCFYGPYADGQGMSDSEVSIQQYVKQANAIYRGLSGGQVFAPVQSRRYGSVSTSATGATLLGNTGLFHVTSDFATAGVTFGGLKHNGHSGGYPYRKIAKPIFLQAGLPITMKLVAQDSYHVGQMQRYMSISEGAGTNQVAVVQFDSTFNGVPTLTQPAALEQTLDQAGAEFASNVRNSDRALFKGGVMKLAMVLKGYEFGPGWCGCFSDKKMRDQVTQSSYAPSLSAGVSGVPALLPGGVG